jgi:hypothetical protein
MSESRLQDPFLRELANTFRATQRRISRRLAEAGAIDAGERDAIIRYELQGLFLGVLGMFDGGTALADLGLVSIVDEDGVTFERFLHEIGPRYLPPNEPA